MEVPRKAGILAGRLRLLKPTGLFSCALRKLMDRSAPRR
jgi:hypothetical protein